LTFYRDDIVAGTGFIPPPVVQSSDNRPEFVYTIGDGYVLPDDIDFADFSAGHVYPKPIVVGTTKNENNFWNAYWPFNFRTGVPLDTLITEVEDGDAPWWIQDFLTGIGTNTDEFSAEDFKDNYKFSTELIDEVDMYVGAQLSARNLAKAKPRVPIYVYRFDWGSDPNKDYQIPYQDAWTFYVGAPHVAEADFFWQKFFGLADGGSVNRYQYTAENLEGRQKLSLATKSYLFEFIHKKSGKIPKKHDQPVKWEPWTKNKERLIIFDADHDSLDVTMNSTDINRTPLELFNAHIAHPNETVRDFIEYYVMWSWHWNWYPNSSVGPFDTSPGPNPLFDPQMP
jgi:carboxylesterase type B